MATFWSVVIAGCVPGLDGVLLGGQAERVEAHRVQHVVAGHALVPAEDVGADESERVADVQPDAGRVREHVEHEQLLAALSGRVGVGERARRVRCLERVVRIPPVVPAALRSPARARPSTDAVGCRPLLRGMDSRRSYRATSLVLSPGRAPDGSCATVRHRDQRPTTRLGVAAHASVRSAHMADIKGTVADGFGKVADAFGANFDEHGEFGAAFALYVDGECKVDIWGGVADKSTGRDVGRGHPAAGLLDHQGCGGDLRGTLVEAGKIDYEAPVASYWPEFAQAGKEAITVGQLLSHQGGLPFVDARSRSTR